MGHRTLKRVPLNFKAPLGKVWEGYINPHPGPLECNLCRGSGLNLPTAQIERDFYDHDGNGRRRWCDKITQDEVLALVNENRLWEFTHVWKGKKGWQRRKDGYVPTAAEVNARERRGGILDSHDGINRCILVEARAKRLGVWGKCPICKGERTLPHPNEAIRKLHEEWNEYEPPTGPGYQLWETCSEGSPVSPVFDSAEKLADWCAKKATVFADIRIPREEWLKMFLEPETMGVSTLIIVKK